MQGIETATELSESFQIICQYIIQPKAKQVLLLYY